MLAHGPTTVACHGVEEGRIPTVPVVTPLDATVSAV